MASKNHGFFEAEDTDPFCIQLFGPVRAVLLGVLRQLMPRSLPLKLKPVVDWGYSCRGEFEFAQIAAIIRWAPGT
jgi:hypothetical protein